MQHKTWLSVLILAVVFMIGAYALSAFPKKTAAPSGVQSGENPPITFYCGDGNTMNAVFAEGSLALTLSDGEQLTLPQVRSGSGIRYEATTTTSDLLFVGKGDSGSFTNSASTTDMRYATCTAATVTDSDAPGYKLYTDRSDTFSFAFPSNFDVAGTEMGYGYAWTAPATTTGMQLAKIVVPKSFEPGTNFGDAWFSVGVSSDPSAVASCFSTLSGSSDSSVPATIGGITFAKLEFSGAGAGNRYDTTSYRAVRDGQCYAIEYTIHYGVFENYPAGSVTKFDEAKVARALDEVAQSFRFVQ